MISHDDSFWMRMAIDLANEGRTAFGAVLIDGEGGHVGGFNTTKLHGPTAHAEMNVINRMDELDYDETAELTLYTTVEPCPMCMGAIIWAGIGKVVYGASIADAASVGKQISISSAQVAEASWQDIHIVGGVEQPDCLELLLKKLKK
jgi:tRNA(Arg) A34 adenosine deaminase TadA